jgi:hypothetical protein
MWLRVINFLGNKNLNKITLIATNFLHAVKRCTRENTISDHKIIKELQVFAIEDKISYKQELMGRTNPLLFFNMTWTQTKWNVQQ